MSAGTHAHAGPDPSRGAVFESEGLLSGIPLLSVSQCRLLLRHLASSPPPPKPLDWPKGRAATDRLIYDIAAQPLAVEIVTDLLGPDVVLWGAVVVRQTAGDTHAWHTDIETSRHNGRFVSLWVGLENTDENSTLEVISGSHRFGKPVQQVAAEHGLSRDDVTSDMALAWARERVPNGRLTHPAIRDGEAVAFDGRIWHASFNRHRGGQRTAIVLQYAAADSSVRMPDFSQLEWPFRFRARPRPPVVPIAGEPDRQANRVVDAPRYDRKRSETALGTHVAPLALPLAEDPARRWRPYPITHGRTRSLGSMSTHVSVLSAGHSPHPPHEHVEEEILIVLDGSAELVIADDDANGRMRAVPVTAETLVYYPPYCKHTIRNTGSDPVTYLMFRWSAPSRGGDEALPCRVHKFGDAMWAASARPFSTTTVFEGPTPFLHKLHAHTSIAEPGGGYDVHIDKHDVALVLHTGRVETLGRVIDGPGVVYYSAGEPHGLRNTGDTPARYLVLEFHSAAAVDLDRPIPLSPPPSLRERLNSHWRTASRSLRRVCKRGRKILGRRSGAAGYLIRTHRKITRR